MDSDIENVIKLRLQGEHCCHVCGRALEDGDDARQYKLREDWKYYICSVCELQWFAEVAN